MTTNSDDNVSREEFYERMDEVLNSKSAANISTLTREKYYSIIQRVKAFKTTTGKKTPTDYRCFKKYEVIKTLEGEKLFSRTVKPGQKHRQMFVTVDELYDIIHDYHLKLDHAGRSKMMYALKRKYRNVTAESVLVYLSLCKICKSGTKRKRNTQHSPDEKIQHINDNSNESFTEQDPLTAALKNESDSDVEDTIEGNNASKIYPELYSRGQVDILDVTTVATEEYKYMLVYKNFVTKFIHLKPLKETSVEHAVEALLDIFLVFGAPNILQSKNGMAVTLPICKRISTLRPDIKIVAAEGLYTPKDSFKDRCNEDILKKLNDWLTTNPNSKWQKGLKFVQNTLNTTFHPIVGKTPCEAVFGVNPQKGLSSFLLKEEYEHIYTEADLKMALKQKENPVQNQSNKVLLQESLILPCNFIKIEAEAEVVNSDNSL